MLHVKMWIAILFLTREVCIFWKKWQKKISLQLSLSRMSHTFIYPFVLLYGWTEMLPSNCAVWRGLHFMVVWIALIVTIGKVQPIGESDFIWKPLMALNARRNFMMKNIMMTKAYIKNQGITEKNKIK